MSAEQAKIIETLGVTADFDPKTEADSRVAFLESHLKASGTRALVLGISGGVDSLTAGLLAQRAVENLRKSGYQAEFIAVRLPYGEQADEKDAQQSLATIGPDRIVTIDIKPAADGMMDAIYKDARDLVEGERHHFHLGNIKARERMIAQYALGRRFARPRHRNGPRGRSADGVLHEVR
jgi:NAD+ synthase